MSSPDDRMNIDAEADGLSEEAHMMAALRAMKRLGIKYQLHGDSAVLDDDELERLRDNEDFTEAYAQELALIVNQNYLDSLLAKGVIVPDGVDESGHVLYRRVV